MGPKRDKVSGKTRPGNAIGSRRTVSDTLRQFPGVLDLNDPPGGAGKRVGGYGGAWAWDVIWNVTFWHYLRQTCFGNPTKIGGIFPHSSGYDLLQTFRAVSNCSHSIDSIGFNTV
jgi:hypothetical protein